MPERGDIKRPRKYYEKPTITRKYEGIVQPEKEKVWQEHEKEKFTAHRKEVAAKAKLDQQHLKELRQVILAGNDIDEEKFKPAEISYARRITVDPFSLSGAFSPDLEGGLADRLVGLWSRRKGLRKIREQGYESFEDVEIMDIQIDKIIKKHDPKKLELVAESTPEDYYYGAYGEKHLHQSDFENVYGTIKVKGPLFGDQPVEMQWRAEFKQSKQDLEHKEYEIDFYFHQNLGAVVSASYFDFEIPEIIRENGTKLGLDSSVFAHIPYYATYYDRKEFMRGVYEKVPIKRISHLYKVYYAEVIERVKKEIKKYTKENCFPDHALNPDYRELEFAVDTEISQSIDQDREQEIIQGLKARQLDEKIFYLGPEADKFLASAKSEEYRFSDIEIGLIKKHLDDLAPELRDREIVDLGAADAIKVVPLLEKQLDIRHHVNYTPVDINPAFVFAASANVDNPAILVNGKILDFSKPLKGKLGDKDKLITLLGGTLGNGDRDFQLGLLKNINEAMSEEDRLLIGIHLKTDIQKTLSAYNNQEGREFMMATIRKLGLPEDKIDLQMIANEEESRIEVLILINEDFSISRGEEQLDFKKGEVIKAFISQKYNIGDLDQLAQESGFNVSKNFVDQNQEFQLAVLEKNKK